MNRIIEILVILSALCSAGCTQDIYQQSINNSVVIHMKFVGDDLKWHRGGCSGTWINPHQILSAAHCFSESSAEIAWAKDSSGVSYRLTVDKIDTQVDLALLDTSDDKHGFQWGKFFVMATAAPHKKFARLGKNPHLGQSMICVGSPYGLDFMVSSGIISKLGQKVEEFTAVYILHTAMINPGSSGGGVFDMRGHLIGVNTMSIGSPFGWAGISTAVNLETIKEFLK